MLRHAYQMQLHLGTSGTGGVVGTVEQFMQGSDYMIRNDSAHQVSPKTAFTRGITCSAIKCIERLDSAGSAQSCPQ